MFTRLQNLQDAALCLVRVVTGYMYLQHGLAKFFEFPVSMTDGHGAVPLFSLFGAGGVLELAGGALLILGLFTRPVAFLLAGQMAVAYFFIHGGNVLLPMTNGGELVALYSLMFLLLVFTGGGKYALDAVLCKKQG